MQKQHIKLIESDRIELERLLANRSLIVKIHHRIEALLGFDGGKTFKEVKSMTGLTYPPLKELCKKYVQRQAQQQGLSCLYDNPRSGRPLEISGQERAKITALACSEAPEGHAQWSLRLLADKVVELDICSEVSHTYVGKILKKTNCNLILNALGVLA